jgi:hypothetical protein
VDRRTLEVALGSTFSLHFEDHFVTVFEDQVRFGMMS